MNDEVKAVRCPASVVRRSLSAAWMTLFELLNVHHTNNGQRTPDTLLFIVHHSAFIVASVGRT
jgi:hypothetical protein